MIHDAQCRPGTPIRFLGGAAGAAAIILMAGTETSCAPAPEAGSESSGSGSGVVGGSASSRRPGEDGPADDDDAEVDLSKLVPDLGVEVGIGLIAGFSSGYAVKKIGRTAAFMFGLGFVAIQVARHYGVLKDEHMPDWHAVDREIRRALDTDGDGRVTKKDLRELGRRAVAMLSANVPSTGAFAVAFFLGLRYG